MNKSSLLRLGLVAAAILLNAQAVSACEKHGHGKKEQTAEAPKKANAEPKADDKAEKETVQK